MSESFYHAILLISIMMNIGSVHIARYSTADSFSIAFSFVMWLIGFFIGFIPLSQNIEIFSATASWPHLESKREQEKMKLLLKQTGYCLLFFSYICLLIIFHFWGLF